MKASNTEIKYLKELQKIDSSIKKEIKKFNDLPLHSEMKDLEKKLFELRQKSKQIESMKKEADNRAEKLQNEDDDLLSREEAVQKSIDNAAGDFRNLEVRTKELDSISSRRKRLEEMLLKVTQEQDKVSQIDKKLKHGISEIETLFQDKTNEFDNLKLALRSKIESNNTKRNDILSKLNNDLVRLYEDSSNKVGTVVLSSIEDDKCSICKTMIDEGRIIDMRNNGNIALCPHCGRIIIL